MRLSELLKEIGEFEKCKLYKEKEFEVFARITTQLSEERCIFLSDERYISKIPQNTAMIITTDALANELLGREEGVCVCKNPKALYFNLLNYVAEKKSIQVPTQVGQNCKISKNAFISPCNVIIQNNVVVEEGACIYEGSIIGNNCTIRSGARISIQDYNYYVDDNEIKQVIHQGKTVLENNVDVGYNSVIGRALYEYGCTYIGEHCKIACNSSIGHDDYIGKNTMIGSNVALGGHTIIGENVNISMGSTIKNAISVGNGVHIEMGAVVIRDVKDKESVFGNPAKRIITP